MRGNVVRGAVGWAVLYALAVLLGRQLVLPATGLALFWPAAGVAALWMGWAMSTPSGARRSWPGQVVALVAATAVVNALAGVEGVAALGFGVANAIQGSVFAWVRRRRWWTGTETGGVFATGVAAVVASLCSMPVGLVSAWANGGDLGWVAALAWVVRNACGTFVVVVAVSVWRQRWSTGEPRSVRALLSTRQRPGAVVEYALAAMVTVGLTTSTFGVDQDLPLAFMVLSTSVWVGSRFSPVVAATHSTAVGLAAVAATYAGLGVFGQIGDLGERALVVQLFVIVNSLATQLLAAGALDRHTLLRRALASEREATLQQEMLGAVLEVMHDGLVVVDEDGSFLVSNSAARAISGPVSDASAPVLQDAAGYGLTELDGTAVPSADLPSALALAGRAVVDRELLRLDPVTGLRRVLSVSAVPLTTTDGGGSRRRTAVVNLRDVTEHHDRVRELDSFAGVVAHDLRNPLSTATSWATLAADSLGQEVADVPAAVSHLERANRSADRAMTLLDELLAFARAGNQALDLTCVEVGDVVADVASDLAVTRPDAVVEAGTVGQVHGDAGLLHQLVSNLVGNAVKYVEPGVVPHVVVTGIQDGEWTTVEVADNGIGIAPEHRGQVFTSFFRAPTQHAFPGTGLGLAICSRVVERHGGRIEADANPATGGTVVRFTVPTFDAAVTEGSVGPAKTPRVPVA